MWQNSQKEGADEKCNVINIEHCNFQVLDHCTFLTLTFGKNCYFFSKFCLNVLYLAYNPKQVFILKYLEINHFLLQSEILNSKDVKKTLFVGGWWSDAGRGLTAILCHVPPAASNV